jgi:hypothetical protein
MFSKLSKESLIKLINLMPTYTGKNIIEIIDEKIEQYENNISIEISNIKINDIKAEIFKTKYKMMTDLLDFKIYEYENYSDVFFTGKEINIEILLKKLENNITYKDFKVLYISSRTIKTPHVIKIENFEIYTSIYEKLKRIKRIETIRLR